MEVVEDYDFNVRISKRARVTNLDKPLTMVRVRRGGLTHTKQEMMEQYVREVMRTQLLDLGINPTERELSLNRHVGALTLPSSMELLREVEAWLLKLVAANRSVDLYPDEVFRRAVGSEWFEVCKFAAGIGFGSWGAWKNSPLNSFPPNGLFSTTKFWLKCLVRHERPGGDSPHVN
jgi:hypothetical protein